MNPIRWLIRFLRWLWETVFQPTLSVAVDKAEYLRGETVGINVTGPMAGMVISLALTPEGQDTISLPSVTTGIDGSAETTWEIPADAALGLYTLTAGYLGVTADTTFRQSH